MVVGAVVAAATTAATTGVEAEAAGIFTLALNPYPLPKDGSTALVVVEVVPSDMVVICNSDDVPTICEVGLRTRAESP